MAESVDERHRKLLERRRELAKRPEAKAKKAAYMRKYRKRGLRTQPEALRKKRQRDAKYYSQPHVKQKIAAYSQQPEVKERRRSYLKEYRKRPEVRRKRLESKKRYRTRPETKELQKKFNKKWREGNPDWNKANMDLFRRKRTAWLDGLKAKAACSVCGKSFPEHPSVIEFHHESERSKESGIAQMRLRSQSKIEAEMNKCITVCANCHRIIHARRANADRSRKRKVAHGKRQWYFSMKATQTCSICGEANPDYPAVMEFHHKRGLKKEGELSSMVGKKGVSLSQIQAELDKCIPVCANCHRIVHDLEKRKKKPQGRREALKPSRAIRRLRFGYGPI